LDGDKENVHTCTLSPHNLVDGKNDMHTPLHLASKFLLGRGCMHLLIPSNSMPFVSWKPHLGADDGEGYLQAPHPADCFDYFIFSLL
jgi:hypothetical protein